MSSRNQSVICTRRDFIKALSLATGALVFSPLELFADNSPVRSATPLPRMPRPLTLGTLLPNSTIYPSLSKNWSAGMELYFRQAGSAPVTLHAQPRSNRLLPDSPVDLIAGILGVNAIPPTNRRSNGKRALLIANDAGANVMRRNEAGPRVFHNSLGYWQANAAMGQWAAYHLGRKAFVASSFYESGYDSLYAFRRGLEIGGGQVLQTYVAHVPPNENDLPELMAAIQRARPDFIYALFSGRRAVDFVRAYADSALASHIPLAGSAFMVDETLLPAIGFAALGVKSALSWSPQIRNLENQVFIAAFQAMHGRAPDAFGALGYDTARWISQALETVDGDLQSDRLREAFLGVSFDGPRGRFHIDAETQTAVTPLYLRQVQLQGGRLVNQVIGRLEPVSEHDVELAALRSAIRTGWTNAYLGV